MSQVEALKWYHVTYGSRKRVFLCSASDVEPEIKSQFGIKKFRLQVFDKDFDDWVDIDGDIEEEQMEDKAVKLNVIGERDEVACLSASSFTSSSSSDDTVILAGNERDVPCTSDVSDSFHEEEKFLPWPHKFELHQDDVRRDILVELLKGGPVSNRIKSAVIQATFDKMCLFTVYPTTDQYNTAAKAVIKSFPNLAIKLPFCEPYDALKNALKDKFRNERRHMTRDVVVKKRKTSTHATTDEGERKEGADWTLPEGETEETIKLHIKELQKESTKKKQDKNKIKSLMALTFGERRRLVLEEKPPIAEIRGKFPTLFCAEQIIEDFSAIISWDAVSEMFYKNLDDIAAKIITYNTNHSKGTLRFLVEYNNFIQQLTEKDKRDATWTAALWILPGFLKEDRNFLFINSDDDVSSDVEINTPVITYTGDPLDPSNITIIAENEKCSTAASFPEAVLILLATYYVFNIQYNGKVKGTLTFLQNVLLQCKDKGKLPQKIISLIAKLQA
ncbi:sterile alpha motif domain-containing protein 3-like isoform X1 [Apostichopus japonicus]|uniref:sterile alpha motif domain-containing protein 3-like isoform X1 n=1 Tax=Stichopus japonicus TaxID=307972 RepID=UPI003AB8CF50